MRAGAIQCRELRLVFRTGRHSSYACILLNVWTAIVVVIVVVTFFATVLARRSRMLARSNDGIDLMARIADVELDSRQRLVRSSALANGTDERRALVP